jgi:anti-sigma regulatory factor (Ser/Thr protein kinase)
VLKAEPKRVGEACDFVDAVAIEAGLDRVARLGLKLAAAEAVTSAIGHASHTPEETIHIRAAREGGCVTFHVIDPGDFNGPAEARHAVPDRGRRLGVIARFTDRLRLSSSEQGTVVSFSKVLEAS